MSREERTVKRGVKKKKSLATDVSYPDAFTHE